MLELVVNNGIAAMSQQAIDKVRTLESLVKKLPQTPIQTYHCLHGGMYARTVFVPKGVLITGVHIRVETILISDGNATVYVDGTPMVLRGRQVIPAAAGRKQAFYAESDLWLTMLFPTKAETVEEAEAEFTDEPDMLQTRRQP